MSGNFMPEIDWQEVAEARSSDPNETREEYVKRMEAAGFRIIYPAPNELQIDIDAPWQMVVHQKAMEIFRREYPGRPYTMTVSKSGKGHHVTIKMSWNMTDGERIAWQAALGSDPIRELLSLIRVRNGSEQPTLFCELPESVEDSE